PSRPHQYEFARLNMTYTLLSKRVLTELVRGGHVTGWDDPRMPTLAGLQRRGIPAEALREFVKRIGVAKANSTVDLENYPEGQVEQLDAVNHPDDASLGSRQIPFSRELYIEHEDFMEEPPKKFFRMAPGREVRLRYAYFITCRDVVKNDKGEVVELRCTYDPETRGGNAPDGRKVKATIHWVSAAHAVPAEVRIYEQLFATPTPEAANFAAQLNAHSLEVLDNAMLEPALISDKLDGAVQFERQGYFCHDKDSTSGKPVFNRTVGLRDSYAKLA
ncbi:MAG: glutamate--tRNA ligase family protein, partial [Hyphomicrobiales bacterium]|nr:glutamate--tRNA ligase family protein [Hyphomicrobiales bacterium]